VHTDASPDSGWDAPLLTKCGKSWGSSQMTMYPVFFSGSEDQEAGARGTAAGSGVLALPMMMRDGLRRWGNGQTPPGEAKLALGDNGAIDRRNSFYKCEILNKF
jgi:hypothetical protein